MDEHHVGEEAIWEKVKQDGLVEMHTRPRNLSDAERARRRKVAGMKCYNKHKEAYMERQKQSRAKLATALAAVKALTSLRSKNIHL